MRKDAGKALTAATNSAVIPLPFGGNMTVGAIKDSVTTGAGPDYARDDSKAYAAGMRNRMKNQGQAVPAFQQIPNRFENMANHWANFRNPFNDGRIEGLMNSNQSQASDAASGAIAAADRRARMQGRAGLSPQEASAIRSQYGGQANTVNAQARAGLLRDQAGFEAQRVSGMQGVEQFKTTGASAMDQYNQFAPLRYEQERAAAAYADPMAQVTLNDANYRNEVNRVGAKYADPMAYQGYQRGQYDNEAASLAPQQVQANIDSIIASTNLTDAQRQQLEWMRDNAWWLGLMGMGGEIAKTAVPAAIGKWG
jgi:hypothetical protein